MALPALPPAAADIASKLLNLAGLSFLAWVVYSGFIWIYNIFFHPLRKFPGPIFAAASPIPYAFNNIIGDVHIWYNKLHTQYGEVVRINPDTLTFINEQAWKDIYMHRQDGNGKAVKQMAKSKHGKVDDEKKVYSILNAPDEAHARQRKMLSHAFSDRALRAQEPLLRTYIDLFVRNLKDDARNNRRVDIVETFNFLTFDIIGELAFGESFHATETRQEHPWFALFWKTIKRGAIFSMAQSFPFMKTLLRSIDSFVFEPAKEMSRYTRKKIQTRIATGDKDRADFMARVLKYNTNDEDGMSLPEMESTFELLIIGGSETTATLMSGLVWFVLTTPHAKAKLENEIRSAFASDSEMTLVKIDQLTYLQAVTLEALRMYSPVPIALTRVTPPEGISICGQWVPGNTNVGVPHNAASLSPVNYHEPRTFAPERHLPPGERPAKYDNDKRGASQPFSAGPRNCLGKNLASAEIKLTITRLFYYFDLEVAEPGKNWYKQHAYGLWDKPPLMINVKERKH